MKSDDLALHPTSKSLLDSYLKNPDQGLILTGAEGVGLRTIAQTLASVLVNHATDIRLVEPDEKGTIPIERVRLLYVDTRSTRKTKQVVIIDDIDAMSRDAENAFLKLLEEPNEQVYFILTSHHPERLLPTILSRTQKISIQNISSDDSLKFIQKNCRISDQKTAQQLLFMANGRPAEIKRLTESSERFTAKADLIRQARDFISGKPYDRLAMISRIKERSDALEFVTTIANIVATMGKKDRTVVNSQWPTLLEQTAARLAVNGHVRAQLTHLALV